MVGQFRLQRSLQDCFRELFQKAVLADDVFRLLVIGQQLINECLVDGHRFPFSSSDGRLHSPFYTLMVGRTGARAEKPNLSTSSCAAGVYTETGRETAAVRGTRYPGSGSGNGGGSGARTYRRGRPTARAVRLPARPQRPGRGKTRP